MSARKQLKGRIPLDPECLQFSKTPTFGNLGARVRIIVVKLLFKFFELRLYLIEFILDYKFIIIYYYCGPAVYGLCPFWHMLPSGEG